MAAETCQEGREEMAMLQTDGSSTVRSEYAVEASHLQVEVAISPQNAGCPS